MTAKEIAETARVSRSTVQRALSGDLNVSRNTRARVLKIAQQLNYRPNRHARALVLRRQKITYAVINPIPGNQLFMQEVLKGIGKAQTELRDFGVQVSIQRMSRIDGREQAKLIKRLAATSVKGIVLVAVDCEEVRQAIEEGSARGIAFVTLASDIQRSERLCFVGQDNRKSGQAAGGIMSLLLRRGEKVACFTGSRQLLSHEERLAGFREVFLHSHDERDIVCMAEDQDDSSVAERLTRALIKRHPDLGGIFVAGGGVPGVCRAVKAMHRGGTIRMVTFDMVQSSEYCREGVIDFVIDQNLVHEGYTALTALNAYVMYKDVPNEMQRMKIDIRIKETLDDADVICGSPAAVPALRGSPLP
jgi:LacI family transcriptional regulator, galactose operon repressor